jgi:hypothetical protein
MGIMDETWVSHSGYYRIHTQLTMGNDVFVHTGIPYPNNMGMGLDMDAGYKTAGLQYASLTNPSTRHDLDPIL